jgi:hypothetical protein
MTKRFEMSMMGELKFFLGFQIKQLKEGTFISQTKYTHDMLKKFDMANAHLDLNDEGKSIDTKVYRFMIGSLIYLCALGPILCLVCACVLDFKLTRKSATWWPLRES